ISELRTFSGVKIWGHSVGNEAPIVSFTFDSIHNADAAFIFDKEGVMLRTGHHCCMPLMATLGVEGTLRASIGMYTNSADIKRFIATVSKVQEMLS
ncbi:MAG: aminotransferase class V-fold PLP-dependent enzyme, partial [Pseudobdellovibrionaceae bacterium]